MIRMYTSPVGLHPFTLGTRLTSPFKTPSPAIDFDTDLAVEEQVPWLTSRLPQRVDGEHVLLALEELQAQFHSNCQSSVEGKYEQAYSLE